MRHIIGVTLCILLSTAGAYGQDCKLTMGASIDLTATANQVLIPSTVAGVPENLALAMGSANNGLSEDLVNTLKIPTGPVRPGLTIQIDGQRISRIAYPAEVHLGQLDLKNEEFLVLPPSLNVDGLAGTIGINQFSTVDFELDIAHGKLNLFLPNHCPGQVVYWTQSPAAKLPFERDDGGYMNIVLTLDGKKVRARLSTGGFSYIGMNTMRFLFDTDEKSPDVIPLSDSETREVYASLPKGGPPDQKLYSYPFKSLGGDGLTITNPRIILVGEPEQVECRPQKQDRSSSISGLSVVSLSVASRCFGAFDIRLSPSLLRQLRLYFSIRENLVYATAAGAQ